MSSWSDESASNEGVFESHCIWWRESAAFDDDEENMLIEILMSCIDVSICTILYPKLITILSQLAMVAKNCGRCIIIHAAHQGLFAPSLVRILALTLCRSLPWTWRILQVFVLLRQVSFYTLKSRVICLTTYNASLLCLSGGFDETILQRFEVSVHFTYLLTSNTHLWNHWMWTSLKNA